MTDSQTAPAPKFLTEFLTVRELAELLRIKERKVYDLAASGAVPCTKVTGKLLFPQAEVRAWIASAGAPGTTPERKPIFVGSHDPLLDWALRQSRCGIPSYFDGSLDGLDRFAAGEGIAAGLHIFDAGEWNTPTVSARLPGSNAALIAFARRQRGLILRPETAGTLRDLTDLPGHRVVPRQSASGAHALFTHLCAQAGLRIDDLTLTATARSESDAVMDVQSGAADVAFGLEALARPFGLSFVPLIEERFDLLVDRKAWFDAPMQQLMTFLHSKAFRCHAATQAGYDIADLGQVRWNA